MTDIYIMWCVLIYLIIGIAVSFLITNSVCKNEHRKFNKFADEHSLEMFIIMLLWPVYVLMGLVVFIFVTLRKWFNKL